MIILEKRSQHIRELADAIKTKRSVDTMKVHTYARIVFRELVDSKPASECVVCGIPLIHHQHHFCSGHWDYLIIDEVYKPDIKIDFVDWVIAELECVENLRVRHSRGHYNGIMRGGYRCSVCGYLSGIIEEIVTDKLEYVKSHKVCFDHLSYSHALIDYCHSNKTSETGIEWEATKHRVRPHSPVKTEDRPIDPDQATAHFEDLRDALAYWGRLEGFPGTRRQIMAILKKVSKIRGKIVRVGIPSNQRFVTVWFNDDADEIGAYISLFYVDHRPSLERSYPSVARQGFWRTDLTLH